MRQGTDNLAGPARPGRYSQLAAFDGKAGGWHLAACRLSRRQQRLVLDHSKLVAEERLDGKFLLSSTDDSLSAGELALLYRSLLEVEPSWRDMKQVLDLRPVYHRKEDRIGTNINLCFLALMLVRVIETTVQDN